MSFQRPRSVLTVALVLAATAGSAETIHYDYDELGRLIEVERVGDTVSKFDYDPGGNRQQKLVSGTTSVPSSITVPSSSSSGNYTVSWGTASGTITAYELFEATDASFSGETLVYSGMGTSKGISGQGNGTYYYRVWACNGSNCSAHRTAANPITVSVPPAAPASISGPFQSSGNYTISWSSSTGATRYELWESYYGGSYSKVYDGSNTAKSFSSKPAGEYTYKAKACNTAGCSGYSPQRMVTVCSGPCW